MMVFMEANVYKTDGSISGKLELPKVFNLEYRDDLVRRAVLSEQSMRYQPQGHYVLAGMQTTAVYVGKYEGYRRGRHMGQAIRPRQKLGGGAQGDVRRIPSAVKGKRAHPHMVEKKLKELINRKEYLKALESAIAGSAGQQAIERHVISEKYMKLPIVVEDGIEKISKTKELYKILSALGVGDDMKRSHKPRKEDGLRRSSKARHFRKSAIIIVKEKAPVLMAGSNIPGVEVSALPDLTVEKLAPGGKPRLSIWSKGAIEGLEKELEKRR